MKKQYHRTNITKKRRNIQRRDLTEKQRNIICKQYPVIPNHFESKVEELFKKNKMNINLATYHLEKQIVHDLKKAVSPSNIHPNDDFYSYINERWLQNISVEESQKYIVEIDNFQLTQDKVYRELIEIIENFINDSSNSQSKRMNCVKNAYHSFQIKNNMSQSRKLTTQILDKIDRIINKGDIWQMLAFSNSNEIVSNGSPFVWSINPDDKNPEIYTCYLESPELSLPNNIYYDFNTDTENTKKIKKSYRDAYFKYLKNLFEIVFGEEHTYEVQDIYTCELEILDSMYCNVIKNTDETYNLISKDESLKHFHFNWERFCEYIGFKHTPETFVTSDVNYLLCATTLLLKKWNTSQWRTYWIYLYIRQQYRWNKEGWYNFYTFQGKFLKGQPTEVDKHIMPIFGMCFTFNTFLSKEYDRRYKNQQMVNYVRDLFEDLRIVFIRIIQRNKWLENKTRNIAIDKLKALKLIIGNPDNLVNDPLLDYKKDDPWGNLIKMANWRHQQALQLVGKSLINIPVIDFTQIPPKLSSGQTYLVNAMYTATSNSIYIPLGYIQKPFINLEDRGLEYNLAYVGFTIAHEMSHALDDWGSQYDKYGKLNDWWSPKDKKNYEQIQKNIVKQYKEFAERDGYEYDAWPSIGEDLADISGLFICLEYLRDFQLKNEEVLPIQSTSFKEFFTYFAVQSREKIDKQAIIQQLFSNPHPLDKYRCNIPLSRSLVFRAIYNVQKNNKMWWNSTKNVWN